MEYSKQEQQGAGAPAPAGAEPGRPGGWWRPVLLISVIVALLVAGRALGLGDKLGELREWLKGLGPLGPLIYVLIYVAATVAAVPGSALTIAAGALFGSAWGVILALHGATLGAALAFLISRYFARDAVVRWLGDNEKFQRLDRLTVEHGAIIVALTRLVPIFPFNLLNYGFGLTQVPFWTYVFWSWLCMAPGAVLYVVGSDALTQALTRGQVPWFLVGAFFAAVAVLALLVRFARGKLAEKER